MRLLMVVGMALLLAPMLVAAQEISFLTVDSAILDDGTTHTSISSTLNYPNPNSITFRVFSEAKNLKAEASFPGFECKREEKPYGADIVCNTSGVKKDSRTLRVEFDSVNLVKKLEESFLFEETILIPLDTKSFLLKVALPEGTGLYEKAAYMPSDVEKSSDGRRVILFWRRENMKAEEGFLVKIPYEKFSEPMAYEFIGLVLLGLFILAAYFIRRRKGSTMQLVLPILKQDEKLVIESIMKNGGSGVNQRIVVRESGYSKAKVSKVLKSLAERNLVKLERVGRTNRIYLSEGYAGLKEPKAAGPKNTEPDGNNSNPESEESKKTNQTAPKSPKSYKILQDPKSQVNKDDLEPI